MNSQTIGLRVAGVIFALMCLAQLGRLIIRPEILVAGYQIPLWPSAAAALIAGALGFWMFKLSSGAGK
ncbi:MAG: hypothetical protein WC299_14430 [Kiritimatiellia bacterium]